MVDAASCKEELGRLEHGPARDEPVPGVGIAQLAVYCNGNAAEVLENAKAVMKVICSQCAQGWSDDVDWNSLLPARFVSACAPEMTRERAEKLMKHLQTLSDEEQEAEYKKRPWSLDNWLYWLQPSERAWHWWDAQLEGSDRIIVSIAVESWPFGWGALTWLFRGSGAIDVLPIEHAAVRGEKGSGVKSRDADE